ncbi:YbjQ family protein [Mycoplasmatota bacterium]|nr:YbjQ family protein [Mycoplasmatota bacterium]
MFLSTTDFIPGKDIMEHKGFVKGATIRAKHIGKDLLAGLKTIVGGEIKVYKQALDEARDIAIQRMTDEASKLGANAIICVRLQTSQIMQGATEMIAYGTAVVIEDKKLTVL